MNQPNEQEQNLDNFYIEPGRDAVRYIAKNNPKLQNDDFIEYVLEGNRAGISDVSKLVDLAYFEVERLSKSYLRKLHDKNEADKAREDQALAERKREKGY